MINSLDSAGAITALDWKSAGAGRNADIGKAAKEFEGLLLAQILRGMNSSLGGGVLGGEEDQAGSQMVELGQEMVAHALSQGGGLGLAALVERGLAGNKQAGEAGPQRRQAAKL